MNIKWINKLIASKQIKKIEKQTEKIYIKNDTLFVNDGSVDLKKYKNIKKVYVKIFSIYALEKYINSRSDIDIIFELPIEFNSKEKEYLYEFEEKYNRVYFNVNEDRVYKISDLKKLDKTMDLMVKDIKESSLSPFEKYLAVYDIVKSYKLYKECEKSKTASRAIYSALLSDYIVCLGYVNLFTELLSRISIDSDELNCVMNKNPHSIAITYIKDPKYNIDGFQLSDPSTESGKKDFIKNPLIEKYLFSNFTFDEAINYYRKIDAYDFFNEKNAYKMLEYMNGNFGKMYTRMFFNEKYKEIMKQINPDNIYENDEPLNIFKDLLNEIGNDYKLEDAEKTISYIQKRIKTRINYEDKLKAIYNVNKFINPELNYSDFIHDNLTIEKHLKEPLIERKQEQIDNKKIGSILEFLDDFSELFYSLYFIKNINEETHEYLVKAVSIDNTFTDAGFIKYQDKIYIRNSIINNDLKSLENDQLHYDEEMNNLYINITPEIYNMTFNEFKEYMKSLINEKRR